MKYSSDTGAIYELSITSCQPGIVVLQAAPDYHTASRLGWFDPQRVFHPYHGIEIAGWPDDMIKTASSYLHHFKPKTK